MFMCFERGRLAERTWVQQYLKLVDLVLDGDRNELDSDQLMLELSASNKHIRGRITSFQLHCKDDVCPQPTQQSTHPCAPRPSRRAAHCTSAELAPFGQVRVIPIFSVLITKILFVQPPTPSDPIRIERWIQRMICLIIWSISSDLKISQRYAYKGKGKDNRLKCYRPPRDSLAHKMCSHSQFIKTLNRK